MRLQLRRCLGLLRHHLLQHLGIGDRPGLLLLLLLQHGLSMKLSELRRVELRRSRRCSLIVAHAAELLVAIWIRETRHVSHL